MPGFNGSGSFVRTYNWTNDANNSINIRADRMDTEDNGFATGLSTVICKDGQTTTTAMIPFAAGLSLSAGTVTNPSMGFTSDNDTGIYSSASNTIDFACAGSQVAQVDSTGLATVLGSAASPSMSFIGDANTGIYSSAADKVSIACNGAQVGEFGTAGLTVTGTATISGATTIGGDTVINSAATTGSGLRINANSLTSGNALTVTSSSTAGSAGNGFLASFTSSGANATASHNEFGIYSAVTNTGTTSTNVAGYFSATGATNNFSIQVPASGGTAVFNNNSIYSDGSIGTAPLQTTATTGAPVGLAVRVASGSAATGMIGFVNSNGTVGSINTSGTATTYNTSSDYRIKDDWRPLSRPALDTLNKIPMYSLVYKAEPEKRVIGFLAHELELAMPEAVSGEKDKVDADGVPILQMVDYSKIVPALIAAIQELSAKVAVLEGR